MYSNNPKEKYIEVKKKSRAGVEYTQYERLLPKNMEGYNRAALRAELSRRRKKGR